MSWPKHQTPVMQWLLTYEATLVMNHKILFRIAHKLVGALVNTAMNKKDGKSLKYLSSSDISEVLEKMKIKMPPGKLIQIIENSSPQNR